MLKILQARHQQYVNRKLPNVQAGFRKAEEPEFKSQTTTESSKQQESSRKISTSASLTTSKPSTVWIKTNCRTFFKRWEILDHLTCLLRNLYAGQEATVRNGHGTTHGSKSRNEYIKAIYCYPPYLTYMQSTSCEMPGWMKHKLESRWPGEISITSNMQMTPTLWQKVKKN